MEKIQKASIWKRSSKSPFGKRRFKVTRIKL